MRSQGTRQPTQMCLASVVEDWAKVRTSCLFHRGTKTQGRVWACWQLHLQGCSEPYWTSSRVWEVGCMRREGAPRQRCADSRRLIATRCVVWEHRNQETGEELVWVGEATGFSLSCDTEWHRRCEQDTSRTSSPQSELQERSDRFRTLTQGGNKCLRWKRSLEKEHIGRVERKNHFYDWGWGISQKESKPQSWTTGQRYQVKLRSSSVQLRAHQGPGGHENYAGGKTWSVWSQVECSVQWESACLTSTRSQAGSQ